MKREQVGILNSWKRARLNISKNITHTKEEPQMREEREWTKSERQPQLQGASQNEILLNENHV